MQQVLGSPALAGADPAALERRLRPLFDVLVTEGARP
jgi:hypothetical protein